MRRTTPLNLEPRTLNLEPFILVKSPKRLFIDSVSIHFTKRR